jgi:Xaa-Pro aminopeptidase
MDYRARQAAARRRLEAAGAEALVVAHLPNIRYLTGFSGSNALVLLDAAGTWLYTDGRYCEQAKLEVREAQVEIPPKGDVWKAAGQRARRRKWVGLEADRTTMAQSARWLEVWRGKAAGLKPLRGEIEALRAVKEPDEVATIRRAVELASSAFPTLTAKLRPGIAETAAAGWLEYQLRRAGAEGLAFETILAGGPHGALVHAHPGGARLPQRGFVVVDYGVRLGGYCSDMTRTVHLGVPERKARAVYATVLAAQQAAMAAVKPGARAATVDRAARQVIAAAGWGAYFPHSTGHGVGLEIHEAPRLAATSRERLEAGQVITIEPGIYIPGWGGVRIEDVVVVTERGAESLTPTPKRLLRV